MNYIGSVLHTIVQKIYGRYIAEKRIAVGDIISSTVNVHLVLVLGGGGVEVGVGKRVQLSHNLRER